MSANMENVKLMTVGDGAVGKTSLLMSYAQDKFPEEYVPTVFDNYNCTMVYDGRLTVNLGLWDTAGQDDYKHMRPLAYPGTHVFLVCFSVISKTSLDNVESYWVKEIRQHDPKVPIVLCGTKLDMRDNPEMLRKLTEMGEKPVTTEEAEQMAKKIQAYGYVECSGKTQKNLPLVFTKAAEAALVYQGVITPKKTSNTNASNNSSNSGCCIIS